MNRNRLLIGAAALLLIWIGGNLALHFGLKHHDQLGYDINAVFPPDKPIVPGMPVEVFLSTGERSAFSYLIKPFTDQMMRSFREE